MHKLCEGGREGGRERKRERNRIQVTTSTMTTTIILLFVDYILYYIIRSIIYIFIMIHSKILSLNFISFRSRTRESSLLSFILSQPIISYSLTTATSSTRFCQVSLHLPSMILPCSAAVRLYPGRLRLFSSHNRANS